MKILQSDFIVGILCALPSGPGGAQQHDAFEVVTLPVIAPLQSLDRATGQNICQAADRVFSIPQLSALRASVPLVVDAFTGDRASSNDCAVEQRSALLGRRHGLESPPLRLPCFAHVVATCQGRAFGPVQREVIGVIATALVMSGPGELAKLQVIMEHVLACDTKIRTGTHIFASQWAEYRDCVLDLLAGPPGSGSEVVRSRRFELGRLLTGDLTKTHCPLF